MENGTHWFSVFFLFFLLLFGFVTHLVVYHTQLTRSVGGGFDNESVAMSALCLTFYFWVRSLRSGDKYSYLYGILTGLSYFYVSVVLNQTKTSHIGISDC